MKTLDNYLKEQLKDPEIKTEWDRLEPEFQIVRALIKIRAEKHISQKQLAELTGINQADISRIENGNANPSLRTLQRLADGLGWLFAGPAGGCGGKQGFRGLEESRDFYFRLQEPGVDVCGRS